MRRVAFLVFLALAMCAAASADTITMQNLYGTISLSSSGITSKQSELTQFNSITAPAGHSLGSVNFSTGALISGTLTGGGVFSDSGSSFVITSNGAFGQPKGKPLFTGDFTSDIAWTLISSKGQQKDFELQGTIGGFYLGHYVTGTTTQYIDLLNNNQAKLGIGHIAMGSTSITTPEPGTLGLLGTGLVGIAGLFRRKKSV